MFLIKALSVDSMMKLQQRSFSALFSSISKPFKLCLQSHHPRLSFLICKSLSRKQLKHNKFHAFSSAEIMENFWRHEGIFKYLL